MGYNKIIENCTEPKETNRQMGPMFKNWIDKKTIGVPVFQNERDFRECKSNCILNISDNAMKLFASKMFGFNRNKGLDFIGKFNGKYIIGEAKFITDFGGHQIAQFDDAVHTISTELTAHRHNVLSIGIMDGVLYIKGKNKIYKYLEENDEQIILSSLVLREFLYSV